MNQEAVAWAFFWAFSLLGYFCVTLGIYRDASRSCE